MTLPAVIAAFFAADDHDRPEVLTDLFTETAVVGDERKRHTGIGEIAAWWVAAKKAYGHSSEPLSAEEAGGVYVVRARVTGHFPGSPVTLTYRFRLEGGKIASLEIA